MCEIMFENLKTKKIYHSGFSPCSIHDAKILVSKITKYKWRKIHVVPCE